MRIYISHPKLEKSIIIPPTYLGYLNSQKILDYIDAVLYSAGEIPADDELIVNAAVVEFVTGSDRKAIIGSKCRILTTLFKRPIFVQRHIEYLQKFTYSTVNFQAAHRHIGIIASKELLTSRIGMSAFPHMG